MAVLFLMKKAYYDKKQFLGYISHKIVITLIKFSKQESVQLQFELFMSLLISA